ncbi:hypothetical protein B0T10DRAFT_548117 [Thelonectria olida]|uniref:Translation initiation factor eIF2B subunit alpha n=1 Tax=Thelonectria olida TaxID=1576542 RepID=A0A9P8W6M1_9HYPO|nr:hypothetical protein B0T10DRAFT_548117 [Thelonectria olida]
MATEAPAPAAPAAEQQPAPSSSSDFDIVATYRHLLASDPHLTKPVAAIESLIALLNSTPSTTVFETLDTVKAQSDRLKASVANPVPLSAGTDLFLQYLISSLRQQDDSFDEVRQHLLANGRLFAARANAARKGIAESGWRFITEGKCVLTHGASRSVIAILERAVQNLGAGKFKVIYVREETRAEESDRVVSELRGMGIPVAEIGEAGVAHVMGLLRQVNMVIVGAEAVSSNGGIISRLGTLQIAKLAMASKPKVPFYVAAETHKFARKFITGQKDLGFVQHVLDFSSDAKSKNPVDAVDFTPPDLISQLITENGIKVPGYVFEQLLDIYGSLNG